MVISPIIETLHPECLIMSFVGDLHNASNIIHRFKCTDDPLLKHLFRYHRHQTRLLSEIFSKIEDKERVGAIAGSSSKNQFLADIAAINVSVFL
jgi:hypothetical protein